MPKVKFLGHACALIFTESDVVIIDPFIRGNPQCPVNIEDLPKVSGILVTHGHADHIGDAIEIANSHDALLIAPYELAVFCQMRGVQKIHPMHIGGAATVPFGWVKLTPALHGSAYTEGGITYTGQPCGFLFTADGKTFYHTGDTGLFSDMWLIGERHPIDCAFIPIGDNFTMGIDDALEAVKLLRPKMVIPMHYSTFPIIEADPHEFARKVNESGIGARCVVLSPGEEIEY